MSTSIIGGYGLHMAERTVRSDVESWAHDLPVSFVECRTMGHRWQPYTASWDSGARAYHVIHECDRCKTQRKAWWSRHGRSARPATATPTAICRRRSASSTPTAAVCCAPNTLPASSTPSPAGPSTRRKQRGVGCVPNEHRVLRIRAHPTWARTPGCYRGRCPMFGRGGVGRSCGGSTRPRPGCVCFQWAWM